MLIILIGITIQIEVIHGVEFPSILKNTSGVFSSSGATLLLNWLLTPYNIVFITFNPIKMELLVV